MKKILFLMTAVLVIAGCSKSEDGKLTLSANQVSLYSGDTKQVTVNDNATWSSKSEFVAEVSGGWNNQRKSCWKNNYHCNFR